MSSLYLCKLVMRNKDIYIYIYVLIHQSRAHRGHIQYEHDLLQLYYNITSNVKKKTVHGKKHKKNQQH